MESRGALHVTNTIKLISRTLAGLLYLVQPRCDLGEAGLCPFGQREVPLFD